MVTLFKVIPAKCNVSLATTPFIFPLAYESLKVVFNAIYVEEMVLSKWFKPKQLYDVQLMLGTMKSELPVSNIILKSWGGVPSDNCPM